MSSREISKRGEFPRFNLDETDEIDRRVIAHWISNDGRCRRRSLVHGLLEGDREFDCSSAKEIAIAR